MNALSDLLTEVKFRERMRGYDYEEVDGYVKTVSSAAAQAKEQIAELERRLAQLESRPGQEEDATEIRETLLRTLVLAQRTADSAVSEARSEARSITDSAKERAAKTVSEAETAANERLRSAEERAARMVAESEESSQLIIAEAKRTAATELASERERAQAELQDLETTKEGLEAVVAEIQARLDRERDMLRSLSISYQAFVEKFEPVTDLEESSDEPIVGLEESGEPEAEKSEEGADEGAAGPNAADSERAADAGSAADAEPADAEPTADAEPADAEPAADAGRAADDPAEAPGPAGDQEAQPDASGDGTGQDAEGAIRAALAPDAVEPDPVPELPVIEWDEAVGSDRLHGIDAPEDEPAVPDPARSEPSAGGNGAAQLRRDDSHHGDEAAPAGPATMPFGVDSPELFDMDAEEDDEFIEQLRQVVSGDAPLPDTDAAMAAFFDHDEEAGPERPVGAAKRSGNVGTRGGSSGRGGRLGPRA
ncbi:MAG: DivIVA domain-containing protein [Acidimicrobiaceae bacterium]|nr:DivIVA domain-containing protein [Acidimicrobiaceae bacterium]